LFKPLKHGEYETFVEYTLISLMMSIVFVSISAGIGFGLFITFLCYEMFMFVIS